MLLILNFSTLTCITNARTTMPFARLHSQMVCTQSEPAEIPQHMFVQILVQEGGDRRRRTFRTTLRTPTPLVTRHCFLVYCARTWKTSFPPYLQMSETQEVLFYLYVKNASSGIDLKRCNECALQIFTKFTDKQSIKTAAYVKHVALW